MATGDPRISFIAGHEFIVAQPATNPLDDSAWTPPVPARSVVASLAVAAVLALGATDEIVAQPAATVIDEVYHWTPPTVVRPSPAVYPQWATDEIHVPIRLDEGTWTPPYSVPAARSLWVGMWQDERVDQAAPLAIDEGVWERPFSVPQAQSLHVSQWQDERVTPPPDPLVEDVLWTRPFSRPQAVSLAVSTTQDELAKGLALDEGTWEPPFSVPSTVCLRLSLLQDERAIPPVITDLVLGAIDSSGSRFSGTTGGGATLSGVDRSGSRYGGA